MSLEKNVYAPLGYDIDIAGAADNYGASVNMKNAHKATFICQYEDMGGADHVVKFYSGAAVSTYSSTVPFKYSRSTAAASAVTTANANQGLMTAVTDVAATGLTVANATYTDYLFVFEVDASDMDIANGEEWLSIDFNDPGGATGRAIVVVELEPRYADATPASPLV